MTVLVLTALWYAVQLTSAAVTLAVGVPALADRLAVRRTARRRRRFRIDPMMAAVSREHILDAIGRTAVDGRPLGRARFAAATGILDSDIERYWARWGDACREAGFEPNTLQGRYD